MTGTFNRTFFKNEIKNIDKEDNLPISVIMGDVNGLKLTNDAFGHLMGDKLLITAANVMKKVCRENDIIVRWGGDEFIIILPKTKGKYAENLCKRINEECKKEFIEAVNLSISLGYSTKYSIQQDIMKVITDSEDMMYSIKMLESKSQKSKTLKIIIETLYERSKQDVEHSKNVSRLCKLIGETLELSLKEVSELEILGDIHDVGKIGVSLNILNKTTQLTEADWIEVKRHSEIGYRIVSATNEFSFLGDAILAHHEWYNGSGYPNGLKGEKIHKMARILAIADAYDAMISYRPYRKSKTKEEAINELIKYKGIQFDSDLVDLFVNKVINKI
ncbi:diguanylate cyclase [Caproiciproducens sp. MSJ-32]|nr:diguanylate cyclase [Caproiciproducens sp. MSJ-32]